LLIDLDIRTLNQLTKLVDVSVVVFSDRGSIPLDSTIYEIKSKLIKFAFLFSYDIIILEEGR